MEEGNHTFPQVDLSCSETSETELLISRRLIGQEFGRFNGFSGENKFYFLQVTGLLLILNIATRLIFAPK